MTSYAYYVPICLYRLSITTQTGTESDVAAESFARNDVCHFPREPKYGSRNFRSFENNKLSSLFFSGFHVFAYINSVLSGFQGAFVSIFYCFFNSETQRHLKLPVRIKASRRITNSFCSRYARIKYLGQTLSLPFTLNINKLG